MNVEIKKEFKKGKWMCSITVTSTEDIINQLYNCFKLLQKQLGSVKNAR